MKQRKCRCGSGELSWWVNDAQGIPLCRVCPECKDEKLSKYRPEILTGYGQNDVNEDIEPEEYGGPDEDDRIDDGPGTYHDFFPRSDKRYW